MATEKSITQQFDDLMTANNEVLKRCHAALAADTPQAERDVLREAIAVALGIDTE